MSDADISEGIISALIGSRGIASCKSFIQVRIFKLEQVKRMTPGGRDVKFVFIPNFCIDFVRKNVLCFWSEHVFRPPLLPLFLIKHPIPLENPFFSTSHFCKFHIAIGFKKCHKIICLKLRSLHKHNFPPPRFYRNTHVEICEFTIEKE